MSLRLVLPMVNAGNLEHKTMVLGNIRLQYHTMFSLGYWSSRPGLECVRVRVWVCVLSRLPPEDKVCEASLPFPPQELPQEQPKSWETPQNSEIEFE